LTYTITWVHFVSIEFGLIRPLGQWFLNGSTRASQGTITFGLCSVRTRLGTRVNGVPSRTTARPAWGMRMDWVVLAGTAGDEATWARAVPRQLLPLPGTTLLESLLAHLRTASVEGENCTICLNRHADLIGPRVRRFHSPTFDISIQEDSLPLGTAGCLKSCEERLANGTIFLTGGSVWLEDDPRWMLEQHRAQGNVLTVFCTKDASFSNGRQRTLLRPAGIYCCEPTVLEHIRPLGYQDLKEQLVPALQRAGLRVGAVPLSQPACQVSGWQSYMHVLQRVLSAGRVPMEGYRELAPGVWCGRDVSVASDARIVGPALIGHECRIDPGAVIIGPTLLGNRTRVGTGTWLIRAVAPEGADCPAGVSLTDQFVLEQNIVQAEEEADVLREDIDTLAKPADDTISRPAPVSLRATARFLLPAAGLTVAFIWAFWNTLGGLWHVWGTDGDYSAGQLVPLAAIYMIFARRDRLKYIALRLAPIGLAVFGGGLLLNLLGAYYLYSSVENLGMVVCLNGVILTLIGWRGYRRIWYPMVFLFLTLPLPHRVHNAALLPLQGLGSRISASILEIVGIPAVRAGHVLEVSGHRIAVAEACSGLRMAVAFLIVTAVFAYFIRRPHWQKVVVLLSTVPIAVMCNVGRIVAAAYLFTAGYGWMARGVFHDMAGLLMVPAALALLWFELWLLSCVIIPKDAMAALMDRTERPPAVSVRRTARV